MKKIWRLGLILGATSSIVAPITTVACGTKNKRVQSTGPVQPAPTLNKVSTDSDDSDKSKTLADASSDIKTVVTKGTTIKDVDVQTLVPYSVKTLSDEALELYNGQAGAVWAGWRGSPLMGSVYTMISLVRALANEYGYDKDTNGTSQKDKFFKDQNMTTIIDENSVDASQTNEIKNQVKFLASLKQEPLQSIVHLPFSIGETNQIESMKDVFKMANINFTTYPDTYANDENNLANNLQIKNFSIWDDVKTPGQAIMSVYTNTGLYREIELQNVKDKYAIIDQDKFENDYVPYVKSALLGFVKFVVDNQDMLAALPNGGFDPIIMDQITYLLAQNTDANGEFKFDDTILTNALDSFNNGSINWLAIKAIELGFDKSITTNEYSLLTNNDAFFGKVDYGDAIPGVHSWVATDLVKWLSWLDSDGNYLNDDQSLFNATDIIDTTYLKGKIDDQKITRLENYIKSKNTPVNP